MSAQEEPRGIGIRLTEAPTDRRDDPRALVYIIDHVPPGGELSRSFEVSNTTDATVPLQLYVGPATIDENGFAPAGGRQESELTRWSTVEPSSVELAPGATATGRVTVNVPDDAAPGERYGVILAEAPPQGSNGLANVAPRVGIRIYLSVGEGNEPASDFVVDSLQAGREDDGTPVVLARVENTGGRALDMRGELTLDEGPGGLSAGPFPAQLGTTIAPGESSKVRIALDPEIPNGPWLAKLSLQSGELERKVEATITFPEDAGTMEDAVEADPVEAQRKLLIPVAAAGVVAALAATAWFGLRLLRPRLLRRFIRRPR